MADETSKNEEPPDAVSNQMPEEAPSEQGDGGGVRRRDPSQALEKQHEEDEGAAGEGTQSTGHPGSAGLSRSRPGTRNPPARASVDRASGIGRLEP